jgi:hypothetical protein
MGFDPEAESASAADCSTVPLPRLNIAAHTVVIKGTETQPRYGHMSMLTADGTKLSVLGGHSNVDFGSALRIAPFESQHFSPFGMLIALKPGTSAELDLTRCIWTQSDMGDSFAPRACNALQPLFCFLFPVLLMLRRLWQLCG